MNRNAKKSNFKVLKLQIFGVGMFVGFIAIVGSANAATLPKGNCADPKPYTDLRHCRFEGADMRNKNLSGTDLRGLSFNKTKLEGATLTNALFDGDAVVHASLDGVIGVSAEALAILKMAYLITKKQKVIEMTRLPSNYTGSNENVAGLDNVFLAKKAAGKKNTIALLAYPRYGASSTTIFARFDNDKFDFPACYRSVELMNDGNAYYFAHWESLKTRELVNGGYVIGALARGADGDDQGISEWNKIVLLELTPTCKLTLLHEEFVERAGDYVERNGVSVPVWCGGELDFHFVDDSNVEIETIIPVSSKEVCGDMENKKEKIVSKKIRLNLHQ